MNRTSIRAAGVIAAVYGYFLIFAQFAFVELIRLDFASRSQSAREEEKFILGAMAIAGIAAGFFIAWKGASPLKIRIGLGLACLAALTAPLAHGLPALIGVAVLTGSAIGLSTVSLATLARSWCGLLSVGIGTGIGYAMCNLPIVFLQSPAHQSWIATGFALIGAFCVPSEKRAVPDPTPRVFSFPSVILLFTALVWLDSAAFFIIQHALDLKSGTWGDGLLWRNAAIHLAAAVAAGVWLSSRRTKSLPVIAWMLLSASAIAVNHESSRHMAGWLYPAAVSLYSVALVSWPGWFSGAVGDRAIRWRAACLYAIAGWFGSANGIGMAQALNRVPPTFIVISGIIVAGVMIFSNLRNWRIHVSTGVILAITLWPQAKKKPVSESSYERGKQVYLSEGCIHCHSQYVRPRTLDEEYWGPSHQPVSTSRPVLIGNRRQGPDLMNIGARRSGVWLKQHFINPRAFSPASSMPSYAHLFKDGRGDDLVSYLQQTGGKEVSALLKKAAEWTPEKVPQSSDAPSLYTSQCAVCHGDDGKGGGMMATALTRPPANLVHGPFVWSPQAPDQYLKIQRIIKFGLPGTDMPGHETLSDSQVISLADYISKLRGPRDAR